MRCRSPPFKSTLATKDGVVDFSVIIFTNDTTHGIHHRATHNKMFSYYNPKDELPVLLRVSPTSGPVTGGTRVTVWGLHLTGRLRYNCKFGSEYVPAIHHHARSGLFDEEETVVCVSPARHEGPGKITFTLALKGVKPKSIATPKFKFAYYDVPKISSVGPLAGPMVGGTLVQMSAGDLIHAKHMFLDGTAESYTCRFGGHVVSEALFDSSTGTSRPPFPRFTKCERRVGCV